MRSPKLLLSLLAAVLLHLAGMRLFPALAGLADLFLIVVVLHALEGNSLSALGFGLVAGLLHDSLTSGPLGLFGVADTVIGYVVARLAQRLVIQRPTGVLGVVSFAAALETAIVVGLALLMLPSPELPSPIWVAVRAGVCGLVGMLLHVASGRLRRTLDLRRRGRMNRIRMG